MESGFGRYQSAHSRGQQRIALRGHLGEVMPQACSARVQ
jgi:hypothetical protein